MIAVPCETTDIETLFNDYIIHMSQFFEIEDHKAWYSAAMDYLDSYSNDSDRHLFALKYSSVPIGFAMVNGHLRFNKDGFAIAEFYIDKQHQSKGCGRELAVNVFSQFPGQWEVAVTQGNDDAQTFWRRIISGYIGDSYKEWSIDTYDGVGFSFSNA